MNKSLITNTLALLLFVVGLSLSHPIITSIGLFALSGAITNWLAVHMLFEKVPGLYGSGVIPERFEEFKTGIKSLMMNQFFTDENIERFVNQAASSTSSDHNGSSLTDFIEKVDITSSFDALVEVIKSSSFGGMLAMVGGEAALIPLKEPFIEKMKGTMSQMVQSPDFASQISGGLDNEQIKQNIGQIVDSRLDELTPQLVKEIIQDMIKTHLGWLVVWGGVFGGLIGLVAAILS